MSSPRSRRARDASGRPPTAAELARRRDILDATIAVVGRGGWASCTLQSVADEIGLTKAAVIYHVGTKAGLIEQAYQFVIEAFAESVASRFEAAADPYEAVVEFALGQLDYMREHRDHARLIAEALGDDRAPAIEDRPSSPDRVQPVVALIEAARECRLAGDSREPASVVATAMNGIVDSLVAAWLNDEDFDLDAGRRLLVAYLDDSV